MPELPEKAVEGASVAIGLVRYVARDAKQITDEALARAALTVAAPILAEHIAEQLEDAASNYPEWVFPPDSDSRDAIGGTAMRHAYRQAAKIARESFNQPEKGNAQ